MREPLKIVPVHGESRSIWHVVDPDAPEEMRPCILATCKSLAEAQAALRMLEAERRTA
jgi:hypothetical protein